MASALGVNVNRVYVQAFAIGCFMAGLGGAVVVPPQGAVLGMGVDALILAFVVIVIGGLGSLEGALIGALIVGFVRKAGITFFPEIELAVLYLIAAVVLLIRPPGCSAGLGRDASARTGPPRRVLAWSASRAARADRAAVRRAPYQTVLLTYGLIFAIAALGFNLLLGYTGLLSFGHSAYFGMGAYAVAFIVHDLHVRVHGAVHPGRPRWPRELVAALFGYSACATRASSSASSRWRCPRCCGASPSSSSG